MKSAKGRVSVEQSRFLKCAAENGYSVVVCYSAVDAINTIKAHYCLNWQIVFGIVLYRFDEELEALTINDIVQEMNDE